MFPASIWTKAVSEWMRRECGEENYQDACPYPVKTYCTKSWVKDQQVLVSAGS
jgi:hypothetical protein